MSYDKYELLHLKFLQKHGEDSDIEQQITEMKETINLHQHVDDSEFIYSIIDYLPDFDFNKKDNEGYTAFYRACENGNKETIFMLSCTNNLDPYYYTKKGHNSLIIACINRRYDVIEFLLNKFKYSEFDMNKCLSYSYMMNDDKLLDIFHIV